MIAMPMSPSFDAAGVGASGTCAGGLAGPETQGEAGGLFSSALSAAIQTTGGRPTAHFGQPVQIGAESWPTVATLVANEGKATSLPDEATAAASANDEPREAAACACATLLLVGALPQAAVPGAAAGGQGLPATRPRTTDFAGVAATLHTIPESLAPADGAAALAASRQILPASGAETAAVMDLAAGGGGLRFPVGPELSSLRSSIDDPLPRGWGLADAHAAVYHGRVQETGQTALAHEPLALQLPLRASGWDAELAQRVVWMAGRQAQWAEITVSPPNLGSIEVHLALRGNDASAYFYSPHAVVREAIDASLDRLRDLLAAAGIQLGQAQVGQESLTRQQSNGYLAATRAPVVALPGLDEGPASVRQGLVDLYI